MKNTEKKKEIGARLQSVLSAHNISYKELADAIHVTPQYISDIARGQRSGSLDVYISICNELNISMDYLILGKSVHSDISEELLSLIETVPDCKRPSLYPILQGISELSK